MHYRLVAIFLMLFTACPQSIVSEPLGDAGLAPRDTGPAEAGSAVDAGFPQADASSPDTGPNCPEGTRVENGQCVDVDECAEDNGGCGDPASWRCENRYADRPRCIFDCDAEFRALMDGVSQFRMGNRVWPSALITHGPRACPLITNPQGKVVVASARLGDGRILQVGHQHAMNRDLLLEDHDGERLVRNALQWMAADQELLRIGRHPNQFAGPINLLQQDGHEITGLRPNPEGLAEIDVYFFNTRNNYNDEEIEALNQYVRNGGGIISSGFAWSWGGGNASQAINGFPGNRTIMGSGLSVTKANQGSGPMAVSAEPLPPTHHALYALYAVGRHIAGTELLDEEAQRIAVDTISFAVEHLPLNVESFYRPAQDLLASLPPVIPSAETPVSPQEEPLKVLVLRLVDKLASGLPPNQIQAHPAAADFPGLPAQTAERTTLQLQIDASYAGRPNNYNYSNPGQALRISTGAYAVPGEVIHVTIPEAAAGQGLQLQIGTHSDKLWNKDRIQRFPQLIRRNGLTQSRTASASAFGGPVYILVPGGKALGLIDVSIENVVRAPYYRHGVTTVADWQQQLLDHPAPWAEIEGNRVIFSVSSAEARNLEDPVELMNFWDQVLDAMADLEGSPHERARKERFTLDRQISAGALHSGYPIMGHMNHHDGLLDLASIRTNGSWGPFHELGHNHQWNDWFLPGTTETTCNLWSVYIHEVVLNLPTRLEGRLSAANREQRRQEYLNSGPDFQANWNVWVALDTYLQLQEAFGWEFFTAVFTDYRRESAGAEGSPQDRIDEWVLRSSSYTQLNLGPFYQAWGLPVSEDVLQEVGRHQEWAENPMR